MSTRRIRPNFPIGSVSTGTLKTDDLARAALDAIDMLRDYGYCGRNESAAARRDLWEVVENADVDYAGDVINDAEMFIDAHCPDYVRYGSHEGDGACIGFWVSFDSLEEDRRDGLLPDFEKIPKGFTGLAVNVTDHGNVSLLYFARGRLVRSIWSVV